VIKHTNPCGLASHKDLAEAYRRAYSGDTVAAFGGIVALNRPVDLAAAQEISKIFYEVIVAPGYDDKALELLKQRKDVRIIDMGSQKGEAGKQASSKMDFRRVSGGFLMQTPDSLAETTSGWRTVTEREPTKKELEDLLFAWKAVKHVKSNAIMLVKDSTVVGMGAGQPSRVVSVEIALKKAGERAKGSVLGSDAFFPFPDGVELAGKGGVTAIVEPGGSVRDEEAIKVANQYKMAMVFTGVRHFRH